MLPIQLGFAILAATLLGLATLAFRRRAHTELRARILELVAAAARRNLAIAPAIERMAGAARGRDRRVLFALAEQLRNGAPLADALADALPDRMLPQHLIDSLRSVQGTPAMRAVLVGLARSRERGLNVQDRISMAFAYPSLLAIMLFGLYLTTEAVLGHDALPAAAGPGVAAGWLAGNGAAIVTWCGLALAVLIYSAGSRGRVRNALQRAACVWSGPRQLVELAGSARMLRIAANLAAAGVPLGEVLRRAAPAAGVPRLSQATAEAADQADGGVPAGEVWTATKLPKFATALLTLSTGAAPQLLAERMRHAARVCDRRVDRAIDRGVAALQPAAVAFFGGLIAIHFSTVMHRLDVVRETASQAMPW